MEEGIVCKKRKLAGIADCSPICNAIWGIMRYENIRLTARFQNGLGVSFAHIAATVVKMCRRYVISQSRKIACHSRHGGFHEAQSCRLAHQRALAPRLGRFRERLKREGNSSRQLHGFRRSVAHIANISRTCNEVCQMACIDCAFGIFS